MYNREINKEILDYTLSIMEDGFHSTHNKKVKLK